MKAEWLKTIVQKNVFILLALHQKVSLLSRFYGTSEKWWYGLEPTEGV